MKRGRRAQMCSRCFLRGHNRRSATCPARGLAIWSNGCELYIAASAEEAARLEADVLGNPALDDLREDHHLVVTPPDDWQRVDDDPLVLAVAGAETKLRPGIWIRLAGRGLLAFDGAEFAEFAKPANLVEGA